MIYVDATICIILGVMLYLVSLKAFQSTQRSKIQWVQFGINFVLALIAFSIPMAYLSDAIGEHPLYAEFRSIPYSEFLVTLVAPLAGAVAGFFMQLKLMTPRAIESVCLVGVIGFILIPFLKPIFNPLDITDNTRWQDGVVIQSTASSCGPSSLTTIFNYYGRKDSEYNIAKHVYTSATSTENWYLARYAKSQGFTAQFLVQSDLAKVPVPAIIGVKIGRMGHFISLLSHKDGVYEVADSLSGRATLSQREFDERYQFNSFVLHITP